MAGDNAQVHGLFTHVRLDKVGWHGYDIQNVKSYKLFEVIEAKVKIWQLKIFKVTKVKVKK